MKTVFVKDLLNGTPLGSEVELWGWLESRRRLGKILFLDLGDSTGCIQGVISADDGIDDNVFEEAKKTPAESSIYVKGLLVDGKNGREIRLSHFSVINALTSDISPRPRSRFDISDQRYTDHCFRNRHLYICHPKIRALLKLRHEVKSAVHGWFGQHGFLEVDAPILTPLPLYEDGSAMQVSLHGENVFLTQCVGFYLDAAAHALERVYNMGPSFRGEESRSSRHLMEYWHIKAEAAWASRDDTIDMVERIIAHIFNHTHAACSDVWDLFGESPMSEGTSIPFPRITYVDGIEQLQRLGEDFPFGSSLGNKGETLLSRDFETPFWVVGIPRSIEPFPYCIDPDDHRLTMTADLVLPRGLGELLGVAEKIYKQDELAVRLHEKGKDHEARYDWVRTLRDVGSVPRGAFGMGLERLLRWMSNTIHVRDCIAFPRTFRRAVYP